MTNLRITFASVVLFTLIFAFIVLPSAWAAITINSPVLTPKKTTPYNPGDIVIITFGVTSDNDTASFVMELMNSTLDLSNSTLQNYTFTLVGSRTNGNWMYVLNVSSGIYQIMRAFATDNSTYVQTADYTQSFLGFKVVGESNTANATSNTTTTMTTTSTVMPPTTATTTQNIGVQGSPFDVGSPLGYIMTVFGSNPIFLVIIVITIIVPIIILIYVLSKRTKNELYEPNQNLQRIRWSQDGEESKDGSSESENKSEKDSEKNKKDDKKHSDKE